MNTNKLLRFKKKTEPKIPNKGLFYRKNTGRKGEKSEK